MSLTVKAVLSALVISSLLVSASLAATLFGIDANQGNSTLDTVSEATGNATEVAPTVIGAVSSGLAYDSANGKMYVSDAAPAPNYIPGLGTVNLSTGEITYIGPHTGSLNITGLAYDSKVNALYGSDNDCAGVGGLATINLTNGASTCLGTFDKNGTTVIQIFGLAYDAASDTLYGMGQTELYTIDRQSGVATPVGPTGKPLLGMESLDIDPDTGVMYTADYQNSDLYTVNKATGAVTLVGPTGMQEISALASAPKPGVTSIPALNYAGLAALALLLAGISLAAIRFSRA